MYELYFLKHLYVFRLLEESTLMSDPRPHPPRGRGRGRIINRTGSDDTRSNSPSDRWQHDRWQSGDNSRFRSGTDDARSNSPSDRWQSGDNSRDRSGADDVRSNSPSDRWQHDRWERGDKSRSQDGRWQHDRWQEDVREGRRQPNKTFHDDRWQEDVREGRRQPDKTFHDDRSHKHQLDGLRSVNGMQQLGDRQERKRESCKKQEQEMGQTEKPSTRPARYMYG